MKKYFFEDAINALNINNYIPIQIYETTETSNYREMPCELMTQNSPEDLLIEKETVSLLNKISNEAKTIIKIITDTPEEMKECLGLKKSKCPSPRRIIAFAEKQWGKKKARVIMNEVATYVVQVTV